MRVVSLPCQAPSDRTAAPLPEAADERERHDRTGDREERGAAPVGEASYLTGEADAEADDRIVGDGRGVAEAKSRPVVEEVAAGGEQEHARDPAHVRQRRADESRRTLTRERDQH